jgi:addiction module HigA family antidote
VIGLLGDRPRQKSLLKRFWEEALFVMNQILITLNNPHPGEVLKEDYLEPMGMTPYRLAKGLGVSPLAVHEILNGKRSITPATALRLSRFFGASAQFWLNLQAAYDLEEEQKKLSSVLEGLQRYDTAIA